MSLERLSKLYFKKHNKLLAEDLNLVINYSQSEGMIAADFWSLYQLRNDFYKERTGLDNIQFKKLISSLEGFDQSNLIMHVFTMNEIPHMILTDLNYTEIIGEL